MNASEFRFNGKSSKEFGLVIGSFDGEIQVGQGGEVEVTTAQPPNRDEFDYYGRNLNVITWNFSVVKNPCTSENDRDYFTVDEERHITKWLKGVLGYKELLFVTDDEPIYYFVYFNVVPHKVNGKTAGFDLTATSNCGYGFTQEISQVFRIGGFESSSKVKELQLNNDMPEYVYPYLTIIGSGDFNITNTYSTYDDFGNQVMKKISKCEFKNITHDIVMDSKNDIIQGLNDPSDFNYDYLKLVDGTNFITTDSSNDIVIAIKYREIRMVIC